MCISENESYQTKSRYNHATSLKHTLLITPVVLANLGSQLFGPTSSSTGSECAAPDIFAVRQAKCFSLLQKYYMLFRGTTVVALCIQ